MRQNKKIPITKPTLEAFSAYAPLFKKTLESGMLTMNVHGKALEQKCAEYIGVKHCVTVSSCTAGLMLVLRYFNFKKGGEVIIPSFTFCASALPVVWNDLTPVFVDVYPDTYTIDTEAVERSITKNTVAILATHVFGVVCEVEKLQRIAKKHNIKLIFDSAHAFGSSRNGTQAGSFGDAEVFSCSPTKVLTTGEGGIVATDDEQLAQFVRYGRNYGDDGSNDIMFTGISARMPELSAAIGLRSFAKLEKNLRGRRTSAKAIVAGMTKIEPRLRFQKIPKGSETTYKDLSVFIDQNVLGYSRDELHDFFASQGIMTRKYFYPPLHKQRAYKKFTTSKPLPVTERIASSVLSLPMYAHLKSGDIKHIVDTFRAFSNHVAKK